MNTNNDTIIDTNVLLQKYKKLKPVPRKRVYFQAKDIYKVDNETFMKIFNNIIGEDSNFILDSKQTQNLRKAVSTNTQQQSGTQNSQQKVDNSNSVLNKTMKINKNLQNQLFKKVNQKLKETNRQQTQGTQRTQGTKGPPQNSVLNQTMKINPKLKKQLLQRVNKKLKETNRQQKFKKLQEDKQNKKKNLAQVNNQQQQVNFPIHQVYEKQNDKFQYVNPVFAKKTQGKKQQKNQQQQPKKQTQVNDILKKLYEIKSYFKKNAVYDEDEQEISAKQQEFNRLKKYVQENKSNIQIKQQQQKQIDRVLEDIPLQIKYYKDSLKQPNDQQSNNNHQSKQQSLIKRGARFIGNWFNNTNLDTTKIV
jgi:hypothetical protein